MRLNGIPNPLAFLAKINVFVIFAHHLSTLRVDAGNGRTRFSRSDFSLFYLVAAALAGLLSAFGPKLSADALSTSISLFSIFAALLFSAQVAMYGIFRAQPKPPKNEIEEALQGLEKDEEKALLVEVNSNISYLIMLSCISVTFSFVFYAFGILGKTTTFTIFFLISHFLLTLLMLIKRSHLLFDNSYKDI